MFACPDSGNVRHLSALLILVFTKKKLSLRHSIKKISNKFMEQGLKWILWIADNYFEDYIIKSKLSTPLKKKIFISKNDSYIKFWFLAFYWVKKASKLGELRGCVQNNRQCFEYRKVKQVHILFMHQKLHPIEFYAESFFKKYVNNPS